VTLNGVTVFKGNWDHDLLVNFLNSEWTSMYEAGTMAWKQTITWDPYQLRFILCPPLDIDAGSTLNSYLGFPDGEVKDANISEFPPMDLFGIPYINVHTNFTMNTIPVSEYLCSVPVNGKYGEYIFFTNYDNSMSTLVLDPDITNVRVVLTDHKGRLLDYPESLDWEAVIALQATMPEGFAPLEM
jgi:hypothetical protein